MFDNIDSGEKETSFSEAYRSQILNRDDDIEENSSKNLIIILILIVIVLALGIFGYSYLSGNNQTDSVIIEKEKVVKEEIVEKESIKEEETVEPPESMMLNNIDELTDEVEPSDASKETTQKIKSEIDETADSVKLEMAKELSQDETKKSDKAEEKISKQKGEDTYLEQLAELSKEIDGEK